MRMAPIHAKDHSARHPTSTTASIGSSETNVAMSRPIIGNEPVLLGRGIQLVLDRALVERAGRSMPSAPLALAPVRSVVARLASTTVEATQRPRRHAGLRFSRKARMPSCASGSWLVAAITSTA